VQNGSRHSVGLFGKRHCKLLVNNPVGSAHTWFFGLTIAVILIPGGAEMHPGPQME
jgi:hypothetical protein